MALKPKTDKFVVISPYMLVGAGGRSRWNVHGFAQGLKAELLNRAILRLGGLTARCKILRYIHQGGLKTN